MLVSYISVHLVKICVWLFLAIVSVDGRSNKIQLKIGGIFHASKEHEQAAAFTVAVDLLNSRYQHLPFTLKPITVKYEDRNMLMAWRQTCRLFNEGIIGIIGPNSLNISQFVQSISDTKEMPQLIARWKNNEVRSDYSINLHPYPPDIGRMILAILESLLWKEFTIIYENDESLSKIHDIIKYKSNHYNIKLRQLQLDGERQRMNYRLTLNNVKRTGDTRFVVICELEVLKEFLEQAQQVGLLNERNSFVILNFDISNIDMEPYQYAGCNITSQWKWSQR